MTDKISSEDFIKAFGGGVKHNLKRPQGDLISREALKEKLKERYYNDGLNIVTAIELIDNAPTVEAFTKEDMAGAYNEGYACGGRESKRPNEQIAWEQGYEAGLGQGKQNRPQGEWVMDGHHIRCNRCNEYICNTDREGNKIPDNFCPNCGADMRKGSAK